MNAPPKEKAESPARLSRSNDDEVARLVPQLRAANTAAPSAWTKHGWWILRNLLESGSGATCVLLNKT
jgi:hypothetical protein